MRSSSEGWRDGILCDGCGQLAVAEHIARRLKRLENMTRYRPIHVQALFLAPSGPAVDGEYLYSAEGEFAGEGALILHALGVESSERTIDATLTEFQRRGFLLAHVLECAHQNDAPASRRDALERRLPATIARIRRSFKPKRVVLLGSELAEFIPQLTASLDAGLVLRDGRPFERNQIGDGLLAKELAAPLQAL